VEYYFECASQQTTHIDGWIVTDAWGKKSYLYRMPFQEIYLKREYLSKLNKLANLWEKLLPKKADEKLVGPDNRFW
jgi:hypothetical protein